MIYDHGSRLYANYWVGCRVWLKDRILSLYIFKANWPSEEEAEEEESLAKILAKVESAMGEVLDKEGIANGEVENIELDANGKNVDDDAGDQ
ncbi:hypothetical protein O6P43_032434 [Quillaja saponaria]|uniref:Uncharacterized protein n=1 Tax=Quillaja saponaria TaxID=32244 RepID=A0AAD7KNM4_QUISA|nr:hypothetical protein O6P43_032434 [Quillaja saponaria]